MPLFWMLLVGLPCVLTQYADRPPPTISASRYWNLNDNIPAGEAVGQISVQAPEDEIEFGLEHSVGFNIIESDPAPLPFTVDEKNGIVFTNQSLISWGGKDLVMDLTARYVNSSLTAKYQVWVKISKASRGEKRSNSTGSGGGSLPNNVNFSKIPINFPSYKVPPPEIPFRKQLTKLNTISAVNGTGAEGTRTKSAPAPGTAAPSHSNSEHSIRNHKPAEDEEESASQQPPTKSTANNSKPIEPESVPSHEPASKLIIALIPTIVIVTSLCISGIIACLFRKKICKKRNKIKKDDMKKSSCSVLSLEESMVLQHWRGTRALSNRYDSWDSDSNNQSTLALNSTNKSTDKWEIPRHHVRVFNILGEGCFGQVWRCEALNIDNREGTTVVAVKMLKENAGEEERLNLMQELQVMKMLDPHPNVVRLLGCCTDKDPIFVIMEYVPHGKLQSYLRNSRDNRPYNNMHGGSVTLTSRDLTSFCYQIARGMQYLSSKGIIHRDLAARNILVSENQTCKVADFGFARDIMTSHVYERKSEGRLPIRWMAPESLYDNLFSVKSDIWSFGVLVWEIVTLGSTPYPGIPAAKVMSSVRDGYRLDRPEHCRRELYNIMYYCWNKDPKERPTFEELVDLLEQLLLTETDYIQLELFPDHSYYNVTVPLSGEKL